MGNGFILCKQLGFLGSRFINLVKPAHYDYDVLDSKKYVYVLYYYK